MNLLGQDCLILGCGYVGEKFLQTFPECYFTKRKLIEPRENAIEFDIFNKMSWQNIIETKNILWTFPVAREMSERNLVTEFFSNYCKNKNVIILSTTSAYVVENENDKVDENFPIQLQEARFLMEEEFRKEGALILHLSGIIGPNRYPKNWYLQNRVKYGKNVLNYIHVQDIIYCIKELFLHFKVKERFNLTSGDYKTHFDIAKSLGFINLFENNELTSGSKKISNQKLLKYLNMESYKFVHYPEDCEKER